MPDGVVCASAIELDRNRLVLSTDLSGTQKAYTIDIFIFISPTRGTENKRPRLGGGGPGDTSDPRPNTIPLSTVSFALSPTTAPAEGGRLPVVLVRAARLSAVGNHNLAAGPVRRPSCRDNVRN